MELNDFLGKTVIHRVTKQRYLLQQITSPWLLVKAEKPDSRGNYPCYRFETINGDPFSRGILVFEDPALQDPFLQTYGAYCHSLDAYYEELGCWMGRD